MFNAVLWTLDKETDPFVFERLCSDLMYRNGYKNIIPLGKTHDRGRDAEINIFRGKSEKGERVFFQYSLRKDWKPKLEKELEKVKKYGHNIDKFVFVTTQDVTGNQMDKFKNVVKKKYDWNLIIYHREWLRLQLEEANKDLAYKYLGIPEKYIENKFEQFITADPPENQKNDEGWQLYFDHEYEKAIPKLKNLLDNSQNDKIIYNVIAGCYYNLYNYKEALKYINYSLDIDSEFVNSLVIKGCILAEDGIASNSKPKLVLAKNIFKDIASELKGWHIYYNLANTLSALGQFEEARDYYKKALEYEENDLVWKNLGTCYYHLENHQKEIECFDKALKLNPNNVEALVSKGVTLAKVFHEYEEGLALLNCALEKEEQLSYRWPHIWFWKTKFLLKLNNYQEALIVIEKGLEIAPDYKSLLDLKTIILSELWKDDKKYLEEAKNYFEYKLEVYEKDVYVLKELSLIYKEINEENKSYNKLIRIINYMSGLEENINEEELLKVEIPFDELFLLISNIDLYCSYREHRTIKKYFEDYKLELNPKVKQILWIVWGINFSKILKSINAPVMINEAFINKLYNDSMNVMEEYIGIITIIFAKKYNKNNVEGKVSFLSNILIELPGIILKEFSSQIGYLSGRFNFDQKVVDKALIGKGDKFGNWLKNQIYPIISSANSELKLLKED